MENYSFDEFFTTALQHNQNGKGGFAVSFYVLLKNATLAIAKVPTIAAFASCSVSIARS
jgi:hypothetical protein